MFIRNVKHLRFSQIVVSGPEYCNFGGEYFEKLSNVNNRYKLVIWEIKIPKMSGKERVFGKIAGPQPVTLSKKGTPLQVSFNWFVFILGASPSRKTSKKEKKLQF